MWASEKLRELRAEGHQWLERHPRLQRALDATGCLGTSPRSIARGVAAGLFVALTPVFGVQTLLMVGVCVLLRGNFPAAFIVSWICNPLTIGPLLLTFNTIGNALFGPLEVSLATPGEATGEILAEAQLTVLGSLVLAIPAALIGYAVALWVQRRLRDGQESAP